ncbi:MAG: hypothetical protein WCP62_18390, partial [Planctomycetota bacterium]
MDRSPRSLVDSTKNHRDEQPLPRCALSLGAVLGAAPKQSTPVGSLPNSTNLSNRYTYRSALA